jgi:hypothetical protein
LPLLLDDISPREYPLREGYNGLRYIMQTGAPADDAA